MSQTAFARRLNRFSYTIRHGCLKKTGRDRPSMAALDFHDANAFDSSVIIHFMGGLWVGARLLKAKDIGKKSDFFSPFFSDKKKQKQITKKSFAPKKLAP
jgi:hypothetical protein